MARTYREIAIEEMLGTVEEAMSQVIDWWADLPAPMKEAIEQFRIDGKKLKDLLPIPKEVSEHVLISEQLNLKGADLDGITKSSG